MALRYLDSCSYYNDDDIYMVVENSFDQSDIEGPYTTAENQYARQVNHTFSGGEYFEPCSGETVTNTVVYGYEGFYTENCGNSNGNVFYRATTAQFNFRLRNDGSITLYRGDMNTYLAQTQPGVIKCRTWHTIEMKVKCANSGLYELRVDGKPLLSATAVDTQYAASPGFTHIYHRGRGESHLIRNIYVVDDQGSYNNDFLGPVWVRAEPPITSGEHQDFLPSGESTNLACVDDTGASPPDIDLATYLGSVTDRDMDTYKFNCSEDWVQNPTYLGLAVSYFGDHNNDPVHPDGQGYNSAVMFHTETEFEKSGEYNLSRWNGKQTFNRWQGVWDRNPSGEIEWSKSDIEDGEFGVTINTGQPP